MWATAPTKFFYGGPGRTVVTRMSGQTLSQGAETEEDFYHQLPKAYRTTSPSITDVEPDQVRGALLWRNAGPSATERASLCPTLDGGWSREKVTGGLRSTWADQDPLGSRPRDEQEPPPASRTSAPDAQGPLPGRRGQASGAPAKIDASGFS